MNASEYFSPDYVTARSRFRNAAAHAGCILEELPLSARGPRGEALAIDIAWLGAKEPQRAFVHTSGMHGVEAFAGSAVQLALLDQLRIPEKDTAIVLVHVLNPFGMAWLRRTNESNVDLNRNFILDGTAWAGAPPLYAALDGLLNPPSPPARDAFYLRAAAAILRHGFGAIIQAIAEGQYEFPHGLFFGGRELQEGPRLYVDWLRRRLSGAREVFAIDLHTGLGRYGHDVVFPKLTTTSPAGLAAALNHRIHDTSRKKATYTVRGGLDSAMSHALKGVRVDFLLQEIGTYPLVTLVHALREENRCHFHAGGNVDHPAKIALREALCPTAVDWRDNAVARGVALAQAAARYATSKRIAA